MLMIVSDTVSIPLTKLSETVSNILATNLIATAEMLQCGICRGECSLYQSLAFGYEAVQGGVDNPQGLCTAALAWHNGPQGSEVPIGNEGCAAVLRLPQSRVDSLQRVAACSTRLSLSHLAKDC